MTKLDPIEIDPKTFLRDHCTLPALPEVLEHLQSAIHDPRVDIKKVAELVGGEPALAGQVLKVVNSAYYGLSRQVASVPMAIAYLGLSEVHRMALSLSVVNTFAVTEKDELQAFWFHSFYTALSTKFLAKRYEPHLSYEELWSTAILHDIGKLVYLKFFPEHYKTLRDFSRENGCFFSEAEQHFSLVSSSFLGTLLCDHWRLPDQTAIACKTHTLRDLTEIEEQGPSAGLRRMICLANVLTVLSTDNLNDEKRREVAGITRKVLDCTEGDFLIMMGDIYELRIEVERFISQFK